MGVFGGFLVVCSLVIFLPGVGLWYLRWGKVV